MEDILRIKAEPRLEVGKKISKKLRRKGEIPAIIYGEKKEPIAISISLSDIKTILKSEKKGNSVVKILREDIEVDAMLHELQHDHLAQNIIHVDFLRIDLEKPVTVSVPVKVKGEPYGVKNEDGFFDFVTREIKIRCKPTQIPTAYTLDVSNMHAGETIKTDNLELGEGVKLMMDSHRVICAVTSKTRAEGSSEAEQGGETAASKPAE